MFSHYNIENSNGKQRSQQNFETQSKCCYQELCDNNYSNKSNKTESQKVQNLKNQGRIEEEAVETMGGS